MRKKIFIIAGYYLPSVKGGGPIQSIKNIIDRLSYRYDFYLLTRDRDLGDKKPFANIEVNKWIKVGNVNVFYSNITKMSIKDLILIMESVDCNTLYLNSFFSVRLTAIPLLLNKMRKIHFQKVILAPRGQFSKGALGGGIKGARKKLYITLFKFSKLLKGVVLHATADTEKRDIERVFGRSYPTVVASNFTAKYSDRILDKSINKVPGELKLLFVSRIHPKKNLKAAIKMLRKVSGNIILNIFGPIEDPKYWEECRLSINQLPPNVVVNYCGIINHDEIMDVYNEHHVFILPTLGENFGHVITEALIGGCPVIISSNTPWQDLENQGVGWDIDLSNQQFFIEVIQKCVDMDESEYRLYSDRSFEFAKEASNNKSDIDTMIRLFN